MYDDIGPIYLGDGNEVFIGRDFSAQKSFSDNWSARIDDAVHDIIQTQLERARKLLGQNMALLERVAQALLEREKLSGEEFLALTRGEELPPLSTKAPDADTAAADTAESDGNTAQEADGGSAGDNETSRNTDKETAAPDGSDKPQDRFF